jgi:predicted TIM-barrel fold metal-dependent hydrolase
VFKDDLTLPFLERVREELPGLDLADAHTHIGANDPDGYRCSREELVEALEAAGARAAVFPMHEPDGYPPANDMVLEQAERSNGRLVAFCRLDPDDGPLAEARRCLEAGARGIKLHPRAEGFTLDHPALRDVFALAHERRAPVLIHAGRGIPALGRHAVELSAAFPEARLILAHAGICDLAWIWRAAQKQPNLYFDTAWWTPSDLLTLFTLVPPGQVLFGSDAPYATPAFGAAMGMRYALQAGLSAEQALSVGGGQLDRLLAWEEPLHLGEAVGTDSLSHDPLLDRVYSCLVSAIGQMLAGVEPAETLALAGLACEVGEEAPQAETCRMVLRLIEERSRYPAGVDGRPARFAPGLHLIVLASCVARTPEVPLPRLEQPVSPSEGRVAR